MRNKLGFEPPHADWGPAQVTFSFESAAELAGEPATAARARRERQPAVAAAISLPDPTGRGRQRAERRTLTGSP